MICWVEISRFNANLQRPGRVITFVARRRCEREGGYDGAARLKTNGVASKHTSTRPSPEPSPSGLRQSLRRNSRLLDNEDTQPLAQPQPADPRRRQQLPIPRPTLPLRQRR